MKVNFPLVGLSLMISSAVLLMLGEIIPAIFMFGMLIVFIKMAGPLL